MPNLKKLFAETAHRNYPMPERPWKYYQEWDHIVLLHWKLPAAALESELPKGLQLDLFEGEAWVSLVLFSVKNMQLRNFRPFPFLNSFQEVNLRTYVIRDGKPGIYFLSVEADSSLIAYFTCLLTGIPYVQAEMEVGRNHFFSKNEKKEQHVGMNYKANEILSEKSELDYWLTERHCLYIEEKNKLYRFDIHHRAWKLRNVALALHDIQYKAGSYPITGDPVLKHYARRLGTVFWSRELVADFISQP
jgi:uncharacterized protein YqjF (DUF2071 family)